MLGHDQQTSGRESAQCRQFDLELPAYLEGEDKPGVLKHARECPFCAVVLADLEQIRFASHHFELEEPPARVWANVRATLAEEGILHEQVPAWQRWVHRLPLLAESMPVGALAGLAVLALTLLSFPNGAENARPQDSLSTEPQVATAGILPIDIDASLTRTLQETQATYLGRENSMEPGVRETYRKSLESLDASIEECLKHCRRDPQNALARQFLAHAYQSKAEVLASALEYNRR